MQYSGQRLHTGAIRPRVSVWCALLLLLSAPSLLAHAVEEQAYTAMQQARATGAYARAISAARAFLQDFPDSVARPWVLFWLAHALYATRAHWEAAAIYQELLHETPTFPDAAMVLQRLGLSRLYSRHYNVALAAFTGLLEQFPHAKEPQHKPQLPRAKNTIRRRRPMRLRKKMLDYVAQTVTDNLLDKHLVASELPADALMAEIRRLITEDLAVEDRLNDEVKEILRAHTAAIDRGNIDYARMFSMVKKQLAKERGLIL